ncbi:MAG: gliding motility protein GldN [Flavobacteriales bacterium]|nr:gliding motility protein GldN [Flavobacteriales bacterium]MBQ1969560.1 gliding motility protein GldN [Flavobacteriales bacterium]MBQ5815786.1 gliding motility protein GldN [Flavobacteriales bacterium]
MCTHTHIYAQSHNVSILNATTPTEYHEQYSSYITDTSNVPVKYPYTEPRDVLWSIIVYETIDLDQKVNLPLYFPSDEKMAPVRKSMFAVLKDAIMEGRITQVYDDEYFKNPLSPSEVFSRLEMKGIDQYAMDRLAEGETLTAADTITYSVTPDMVTQYRIKGMWYFDKRHSELRYRLLGIAPYSRDASGVKAGDDDMVALFWIWYPDARKELDSYPAFNPSNAAQNISYDDILTARRFSSIIYKEENMYADRAIEDYLRANALFQLREGERIKEMIRAFEMNMWVY